MVGRSAILPLLWSSRYVVLLQDLAILILNNNGITILVCESGAVLVA